MRVSAFAAAVLCAIVLGACGDTLQDRPVAHNLLEDLMISPFPVYWLGESFGGDSITEAFHDPGGAFSISYGDCLQGGQGTCTPPLRVITSPDNSFLPGGGAPSRTLSLRGVTAHVVLAGRAIVIATGGVVLDIYGKDFATARAAALAVVPINAPGSPGKTLPARQPDTGFASTPLPLQVPATVRPLG